MAKFEALEEIVAKMRELGIYKYKTTDLELELTVQPKVVEQLDPETLRRIENERSDMDRSRVHKTLFAASAMRPRTK